MAAKPLAFEYVNAHQQHSVVQLVGWKEQGAYLVGKCLSDGRVKTYRIDRVQRYLDGCDALLKQPIQQPPPKPLPQVPEKLRPEVCFTGFEQDLRDTLSILAANAGLKVVKSVTVGLSFLVCGPNAGPVKVRKAREAGIYILTQQQAEALLETGELPDSQVPIETSRPTTEVVPNPAQVFAHWAYRVEPHHWPMLGLLQLPRIDQDGKSVLVWVKNEAGYSFQEGDIIYRIDQEFLQVIYVDGTGYLEVRLGSVGATEKSRGYLLQEEQLLFWLETGLQPGSITEVFAGTSHAGLLAWQLGS